ncbi:MAG: FTR1 family protein [Thaumarchaeota archaeon]|nr:FTR1 family protein [Nitrososphaerota archaeon]
MTSEIPAFLLTFREALEAALIVAILLAYLRKIGKTRLSRYVWFGTSLAIGVSLLAGNVVLIVYGGLTGVSSEIFEGLASLTAMGILTYMIFWMAGNSKRIKGELERKIDISLNKGQLLGIASLAFVAVFREGVETVLFLTALFVSDVNGSMIGMIAGVFAVGVLGALMLRGSERLPIRNFFKYTSILLVIFSAGLLGSGVHELVEVAEGSGVQLGVLAQAPFNINPADATNPLHERGIIGSVLKSLVGYDGNPEWVRVIAYVGYWLAIGPYLIRTYAPSVISNFYGMSRSKSVLKSTCTDA